MENNFKFYFSFIIRNLLGHPVLSTDFEMQYHSFLFFLKVFDDVYTELTMAILQFLQGKPSEEKVFRCMKALDRFCTLSRREVPQLVKMIGPEPSKFCGMSSRVEHLCNNIEAATAKF